MRIEELQNKRFQELSHQMKNGGRALTSDQLHKLIVQKVPGGLNMDPRLVRKMVYSVMVLNKMPKSIHECWQVELPRGRRVWEHNIAHMRKQFATQQKEDTTLTNVQSGVNPLPDDLKAALKLLSDKLKEHKFVSCSLVLQDGKANVTLEEAPRTRFTQL